MQRLAAALLLTCTACHFRVGALPGPGGDVDLAVGSVDLGAGGDDLASAGGDDLAGVTVDMTSDPCANPPALGSGNVAAQCVIGNPPTIDGNLADWPTSLFTAITHETPGVISEMSAWSGTPATDDADLSGRWAVRWDQTYLYVAVSVVDDVRATPNTTALTQNDCVELFVDGLHNRTIAYGADDWQLAYSADQKSGVYKDGTAASLPAATTVQKAFGGTSPDWTVEVAVPWTMLGGTPAALGRVVGFDLKIDDNDGDTLSGDRDRDLVMYYLASNMGSCTAPYCRTDAFGAVQLQGR